MKEQIMSKGKSLEEFRVTKPRELFETPTTLPAFFEENLKDDARVIKVFSNDPQANLRIFYYQYLKLCYEFDHNRYQEYINKIQQIVLDSNFQFCFSQNSDPSIQNNDQFKRLILEFLEFMNQSGMIAQKTLNNFPFMDKVFCAFFRTLLIDGQKAQTFDQYVDRTTIFEFLSGMFDVQIISYGDCMKFVDTDIFSYQQQPTHVYLVYIDYEKNTSPIDKQMICQSYEESLMDKQCNNQQIQNQVQDTYENNPMQNLGVLNNSSNTYSSSNQQNNPKTTYIAQSGIYEFQDFTNASNHQNKLFSQLKEQKKTQNVFDNLVKNESKKTLQQKFKEKTNGSQDAENKSFQCIVENEQISKTKQILGKQSTENKTPGQTTLTMEDYQKNKSPFQPFEQIQLQIPTSQSYDKSFFNSSYSYSNQYKNSFTSPYVNSFSNTYTPQQKTFTAQAEPSYFPKNNLISDSYQKNSTQKVKIAAIEKKGPKHLRRLSQEFTHSPVLQQVSQPYQSFIIGMIKRAREQRNRLSNFE